MDNLTHSIVGIALGHTLDRRNPHGASAASVWTAILASNLPDADVLPAPLFDKVWFLVQHRGWTHTFLFVPLLAFAAAGIVLLVRRWRLGEPVTRRELVRLTGIAAVAAALHVVLDFLNSYGVHPFAPFAPHWMYGDTVFIAEPLVWWAFVPFVASHAATASRRAAWLLATGVLSLAILGVSGAPLPIAIAVAAFAVASWALQRSRPGTAVAWGLAVAVVAMFAFAATSVRARVASAITAGAPSEAQLDLVTTPMPANPFCWRVQSVGLDGDHYVAREGFVSLVPALAGADDCFPARARGDTAPLVATTLPSTEGLAWRGEFRRTLTSFRDQAHDCRVRALLGFVRVPFWSVAGRRNRPVYGDLRYDFGDGESFGEVRLEGKLGAACPHAPWTPPRADLLGDDF